jgi:hypothetical protein
LSSKSRGYFSTPYGERELFRLAKSSDSLERWEVANALGDLNDETGSRIFDLLKDDHDSLVQKALASHEERFGSSYVKPTTRSSTASGGAFREAWGQPLGPLKIESLSAMANAAAIAALHAQNRPSTNITFPQANSVPTLMAMLDQILDTSSIHGRKLGLVDRQVLYYRDALNFLGLIEVTSRGMLVPNAKISHLKTPYQRLDFIIRSLLHYESTSAAYLGLCGAQTGGDFRTPSSAERFFAYFSESPDSRGLSGSTLARRAQTALAWATQITNILGIQVKDPAAWKSGLVRQMPPIRREL